MINKRTSLFALFFALAILGLLTTQLPNLKFDYELERFFPNDDTDLAYYQEFSQQFGYDNDYLLLGFETNAGIFQADFLVDINDKLKAISKLEPTVKVLSSTSLKTIVATPLGKLPIPLLHITDSTRLLSDSLKLRAHPLYREMFLSKSGKAIKAVVVHQRFTNKENADSYVTKIKSLFEGQSPRVRIAGKAIAQTAFVEAIKADFGMFIALAVILIFLLLLVYMRNLLVIVTSLAVAGFSVVGTIGLMAFTGKQIDVLSSLIPTILLVVSMSDIIHLFAHIQREYLKTGHLSSAVNQAVKHVGMATLLTSTTTAIGFITLISINVNPIIDLGIYAALGILFAFIITYLLFPSIVTLTKPNFFDFGVYSRIEKILLQAFSLLVRKKKTIITTCLIVAVTGGIGLTQLKIDAFLVDDLPNDNLVKNDFVFFDREFSGSKPFTLSIWLKDSAADIYSPEIIGQIDKIEQLIREKVEVSELVSPAVMVKLANQSLNQGAVIHYKLPESERGWRKSFQWIRRIRPERGFIKVSDKHQAQITGYFQDLGSADATTKQQDLMEVLDMTIDHRVMGYRLTGTSVLVDKSHELLSTHLIRGLLIAIIMVSLIAGVLFRSWRMIIITLVPNLFPILLVAAIMGYLQIPISLSTSVIFAISFGIVVDDTIHFLSQFKYEYQSGFSQIYAIKRAILVAGGPIFTTTLVLTCGFLVFCFSNFNATFFMGLFVSISFITALLADLFLLPLLILCWFPDQNKPK